MAKQPKMPKWPKGLKTKLKAAQKRADRLADIAKRKKEISDAQKKLATLKNKNS